MLDFKYAARQSSLSRRAVGRSVCLSVLAYYLGSNFIEIFHAVLGMLVTQALVLLVKTYSVADMLEKLCKTTLPFNMTTTSIFNNMSDECTSSY